MAPSRQSKKKMRPLPQSIDLGVLQHDVVKATQDFKKIKETDVFDFKKGKDKALPTTTIGGKRRGKKGNTSKK